MEMQNQAEWQQEESYLRKTLALAEEQLGQAKHTAEKKQQEIIEAKREAYENATQGTLQLSDAHDFEALIELSQYTAPVTEGIADYEEEQRKIARLEQIVKNPYFARIDFQFAGEEEAEAIYIGRSSLSKRVGLEQYVYDWRSPIASVFYRFMVGEAFYDAPGGRVEGTLQKKRQYEIENGTLQFYFDMDRMVEDAILRRLLSQNTSPKMKAIVETIQQDQDIVIRDMEHDLLLVQGVAGSGKTSIALHRAAYLMYQGLQNRLGANNILIISPNTAFEEYISGVLPELGEEQAASVVLEDLLKKALKNRSVQARQEVLEMLLSQKPKKNLVKASLEWKLSEEFRELLERFLADIPGNQTAFLDIFYKGNCVITKEELQERFGKRPELPLCLRLEQLKEYVLEAAFGTARKREDAEERSRIRQEVEEMVPLDAVTLYQRLFSDMVLFQRLLGKEMSKEQEKIFHQTQKNLQSGLLCYEDATAAAYLALKLSGNSKYREIQQVVIDEAQDYYPLQYELFALLFPKAKFTVLGDIYQTLAKTEDLSLYERIQTILNRKSSCLLTLNKSFRCTNEILEYGLQFIERKPEIQSFNRTGEEVSVIPVSDPAARTEAIVEEVKRCQEQGFGTICLLCRTRKRAAKLLERLAGKIEVRLAAEGETKGLQGVFLLPIYMAKGLEFDAVILCDVSQGVYEGEEDRRLLYVACTRALHRLSLICEKEPERSKEYK